MNCVMRVNSPCPLLLKQGHLHSGFLCLFCANVAEVEIHSVLELWAGIKMGRDLLCKAKASLNLNPELEVVMLFKTRH